MDSNIIGFHLPTEPYGCFSNWYHAEFDLAGKHYYSSEQYMMYQKVLLGGRYDLANRIMETRDPSEAKDYASAKIFPEFKNIENIWNRISRNVVKRGVRAKFSQNKKLLDELLGTGNALLAECAGQDKIWGIGINLHNEIWRDVSNWNGKNYLGRILMELREEFQNEINRKGFVEAVDFRETPPSDAWNMTAGTLKRIPQYYDAIHTYAEQLPAGHVKNCFYNDYSLNDWDIAMHVNMGGGLPIIGFYEMKQEVYEIERRLSYKNYASELFAEEPYQWGLRGDPFFWNHLKNMLADKELPIPEKDLEQIVYEEFFRKTGHELTVHAICFVDEYAHGGMSSGHLSGAFWIEKAIPLLKDRLKNK